MSYSDEEVTAAVEKLVRTSLRREYGTLGNRKVGATFSDIQDAAAGVFITQTNAAFYVVDLASNRLAQKITSLVSSIAEMDELLEGTGRYVTAIGQLSPLANARTALAAMSTASSSRASSFLDIESIPAFQRFDINTQRFLDESSSNLRQDGELARTPSEARELLGTAFTSLEEQHAEVVRLTGLLATAIEDYEGMSLPQALSSNIIENSRSLLDERYTELQALTPQDRLKPLRDVTLDVLATRAVVREFGSLSAPTMFYVLEGELNAFADGTRPAVPASVSSDFYGPYPITDSQFELRFTAEGDVITVPIQGSFVARFDSILVGDYDIGSPPSVGDDNDQLRLQLYHYPTFGVTTNYDVTFTTDAAKTAWEVCNEINAAIAGVSITSPLLAEPYLNPQKWAGDANVDETGSAYDVDFISTNPSLDFTNIDGAGLALLAGDIVIVRDASSAWNGSLLFLEVDATATRLQCSYLPGFAGSGTGDETNKNLEVGVALAPRLRLSGPEDSAAPYGLFPTKPDYQYQALVDRTTIIVPTSGPVDDDMQSNAAFTIGLYPGLEARSKPTPAVDVATSITDSASNNTYVGLIATPRVEVTREFEALYYSGTARTKPEDVTKIVLTKFEAQGDMTAAGGAPYTCTFTVSGAESAGVEVGDAIVVRASSDVDNIDRYGTISSVSDTQIVADLDGAVTADTGVGLEVGPDLGLGGANIGFDATIIVSGQTGNEGTYTSLENVTDLPIELTIDATFSYPAGPGNAPVFFTAEVGRYKLSFKSFDTTLSTSLVVDDQATSDVFERFFDTGSGTSRSAVGTTPYALLPEWPRGLEEGDQLELYTVQFDSPSYAGEITSLTESELLIELSEPLSVALAGFNMSLESAVPFARIRRQKYNNYTDFKASLDSWLSTSEAQTTWFNNFRALVNPLTVNTNPTPSQVSSAQAYLQGLTDSLAVLDGYIQSYSADVVDAVDVLIESFVEKGADRAVDLLLEGRFADFFGLDRDDVSYAGALQKAIRAVNREDLPVRRDNRNEDAQVDEALLASYESTDYEFFKEDIDEVENVVVPDGVAYDTLR